MVVCIIHHRNNATAKQPNRETEMDSNTEATGTTITEETYFVFYGDHDMGSKPGFMVRETLEAAARTARLMADCGYRMTETRHVASISDGVCV